MLLRDGKTSVFQPLLKSPSPTQSTQTTHDTMNTLIIRGKHLIFSGKPTDWPQWRIKISAAIRLAGYGSILAEVEKHPNDSSKWDKAAIDDKLDQLLFDNLILLLEGENATVACTLYDSDSDTTPQQRGSLIWQFLLGKYRKAFSTPALLLRLKEECMQITLQDPADHTAYIATIRRLVSEMNTCVPKSASFIDHVGYLTRGIPPRPEFAALLSSLRTDHAEDPVGAERTITATCQTLAAMQESMASQQVFSFQSHSPKPPLLPTPSSTSLPPGLILNPASIAAFQQYASNTTVPPRRESRDWRKTICYNCKERGHGWRRCKKPHVAQPPAQQPGQINATAAMTPTNAPNATVTPAYLQDLAALLMNQLRLPSQANHTAHVPPARPIGGYHPSSHTDPPLTPDPEPPPDPATFPPTSSAVPTSALLDTGATHSVSPHLHLFRTIKPHSHSFRSADKRGSSIQAYGLGTLVIPVLDTDGHIQQLEVPNCYYCPDVSGLIVRPKDLIHNGYLCDPLNLMTIKSSSCHSFTIPVVEIDGRRPFVLLAPSTISSIAPTSELNISHLRFLHSAYGHINLQHLSHMFNIPIPPSFHCSVCLKGKIKRRPFLKRKPRTVKKRGEKIHTDICGPITPLGPHNEQYLIFFIDEYTGEGFLYPMKQKSDATEKFQLFLQDFGQRPTCIKSIRADNAQEYKAGTFAAMCANLQIRQEFSTPHTPQQNGLVERRWQTINNMSRCMLIESGLPKYLWPYACAHANFIFNRVPRTCTPQSSKHKKRTKHKTPTKHPIRFGQRAIIKELNHTKRTSKFDPKGLDARFLCYAAHQSARIYYIPSSHRILASRDDVILNHDISIPPTQHPTHIRKQKQNDTWELNRRIFQAIEKIVGTHHCDLFASQKAHLCKVFFTKHDNAFTKIWTDLGRLWINPPWELFEPIIEKIIAEVTTPFSFLMPHTNSLYLSHLIQWSVRPPLVIPHTPDTFTNKDSSNIPTGPPPWKYTLLWDCNPLQKTCPPDTYQVIIELIHKLNSNQDVPTISINDNSDNMTAPSCTIITPPTPQIDDDPPTEPYQDSGDDTIADNLFGEDTAAVGLLCGLQLYICSLTDKNTTDIQEPRTFAQAMKSPQRAAWIQAIIDELQTLIDMRTFTITERPANRNVLTTKDLFKLKRNAQQEITRYKHRCVARGYTQIHGEDYLECHSNVIRKESVRYLCALTAQNKAQLYQIDIKNAYPTSDLKEDIYIEIPKGISLFPDHHPMKTALQYYTDPVFKLNKSLYGLKQAGKNWEEHLSKIVLELGYKQNDADPCLYEFNTSPDHKTTVPLPEAIGIYVDDIAISAKTPEQYENLCTHLDKQKLTVTKLGLAKLLLGVRIIQEKDYIRLTQDHFITEIAREYNLQDMRNPYTPMHKDIYNTTEDNESKIPEDYHLYRGILGKVLYVADWTRPDIAFAVSFAARKQNNPNKTDGKRLKRIVAYLLHTKSFAIEYRYQDSPRLHGFTDSDLAQDPSDRKSVMGYINNFLGPISWKSNKQEDVSLSTANAEYVALSEGTRDLKFLTYLTQSMYPTTDPPTLYCDNMGAIQNCKQELNHKRAKHIDIKHHFVKDEVKKNRINITHVRSTDNIADILTKPLGKTLFTKLRDRILIDLDKC